MSCVCLFCFYSDSLLPVLIVSATCKSCVLLLQQIVDPISFLQRWPVPSDRQHLICNGFLEDKREVYQKFSVLSLYVLLLCTVISTLTGYMNGSYQ